MEVNVQHAPTFAASDAGRIAAELFGIEAVVTELPSERDQNFHLVERPNAPTSERPHDFVLKIANATESFAILEFQHAALDHLHSHTETLALPDIIPARDGHRIVSVPDADGRTHYCRVLTYVPGVPLAKASPHSTSLLESLGRRLGEMDRALATFTHPAMDRRLPWNLRNLDWVAPEIPRLLTGTKRALVERLLERALGSIEGHEADLRLSVIHNDWNDYNVLADVTPSYQREVAGVVDFGDMVRSFTVADPAVAAAYAMLDKPDPIAAAAAMVRGYHAAFPLPAVEIEVLFDLICARLCVSAVMAARQKEQAPDNAYLDISQRAVWSLLERLDTTPSNWPRYVFRDACGFAPCPQSAPVVEWLQNQGDRIHPVTDHDLRRARVVVFNLSPESAELGDLARLKNVAGFTSELFGRISSAGAALGVGRHGEARLAYLGNLFSHPGNDGPEPRTIHIGIDLFVPPGSPVYAPLAGIVHSFQDNARPLDYGPTIVLEHRASDLKFYTLYGHLDRASLSALAVGQAVAGGSQVGRVGGADVNGGWPPHLHVQLIVDMLGQRGDFLGVAPASQERVWRSISPAPNVILGIPQTAVPPATRPSSEILRLRTERLGANLSISYARPLTIVRGYMQHLYDDRGRRYLDCVNNVAHVGHAHPRVARAVGEQMGILNTNTRYLHEYLVRYAERLAAAMPRPLDVCFIVCSGSEANELALRLARAYTRARDIIVLDAAYHGNTTTLVEISPYKCEGPGGEGLAPYARKVSMPDPYRGRSGGGEVPAAVRQIADAGRRPTFIAESLLSCGGQIVLPEGYLLEAYEAVRLAGGITIADEVQTGFGRVGTHMWGFETHGVVPDIVTLGKPMGNGFPIGAAVTRREVADAFANGMEYFNTFGGNAVACAAGLAVLDIVEEQQLQQHARQIGELLTGRLEELKARFDVIGDVRGTGLLIGVELVQNRHTREPAPRQATYIVNRMRDRGILLSTDGPAHNVIKIKPPMIFDEDDVTLLMHTLETVLREDAAKGAS